ncbi:tail fiber assembly protein [Gilliamella sp. wkB171]|uniref:tail fiber assembly protein n=1 Tax=Gilliamella sp. wkB171 TaxID=3120258 RepID=UPI0008131C42|nr:tail fiber assembly protein [Gilliamella apicola]OCL28399.1 hypothetical protein A9G03_01895 [Gilliamella apicola]
MKHFYNTETQSFFIDTINDAIPLTAIEITQEQHDELFNAINMGCIIFDDLTYSEPKPSQFYEWDKRKKKWVENIKARNDYTYEQNHLTKKSLLSEANDKISYLQDAVDAEMATEQEVKQLGEWKRYRVLVNRIDVEQTEEIEWPTKPIK